jgi:hypothetical protein
MYFIVDEYYLSKKQARMEKIFENSGFLSYDSFLILRDNLF